jgi:hypothetical protein
MAENPDDGKMLGHLEIISSSRSREVFGKAAVLGVKCGGMSDGRSCGLIM